MQDLNSVDMYEISSNNWSPAPALNIARIGHSSCVLGDKIFTFCGRNSRKQIHHNSAEILDARAVVNGDQGVNW